MQEVDVVRGIEDTLVLLGHVTTGIRIVREYTPICRPSLPSAES